ncbi:prefoldin subunit 5-like [Paramacrobiotus metropolitanus]|uniref:prefoldin subunit 5-like n=1 Tax=Paramacrobiotus metropolitanus TaxID=2943436 RepID=UPI00244626B3|nr:prefoldin subunit 5-like [Paramacrobiotus metropolitanus]
MAGPVADQQRQIAALTELQNIKQKFENDMTLLTDSIQKLQAVQQHFLASQETTKQLEQIGNGEELLVPLCDGLLVRGKTVDCGTNLVDIGAGYFVEMSHEKCREHFKRRIEFINVQLTNLQKLGQEKLMNRQHVMEAMQKQMAQMRLNMPKPTAPSR